MNPTHYALMMAALLMSEPASARECSRMEAYAAETVTGYLSSWREIHSAFKQFGHCDDGGIAEGFDEAITVLWEREWVRVPEMLHEFAGDPAFKAFIYRRIGTETVPADRWQSIIAQAKAKCPEGAEEFCGKVIASASR